MAQSGHPHHAAANGVGAAAVEADLVGRDEGWGAVLAGDVCYERDLAQRVTGWPFGLSRRDATVPIGDPGRSYLPTDRPEAVATYLVSVTRSLEDADVQTGLLSRAGGRTAG